jgi:transposase
VRSAPVGRLLASSELATETLLNQSSATSCVCRAARVHAPAKAYLERKQSEGKSRREALRCLKRQLARTVYTALKSEPLLT